MVSTPPQSTKTYLNRLQKNCKTVSCIILYENHVSTRTTWLQYWNTCHTWTRTRNWKTREDFLLQVLTTSKLNHNQIGRTRFVISPTAIPRKRATEEPQQEKAQKTPQTARARRSSRSPSVPGSIAKFMQRMSTVAVRADLGAARRGAAPTILSEIIGILVWSSRSRTVSRGMRYQAGLPRWGRGRPALGTGAADLERAGWGMARDAMS